MYKPNKAQKTSLKINTATKGETIEQKIGRIVNNREPIKDGAPIIYTDRKEGVLPQYDIRTDRMEIALEATDAAHKQHLAERDKRMKERDPDQKSDSQNDGGAEPTNATDSK